MVKGSALAAFITKMNENKYLKYYIFIMSLLKLGDYNLGPSTLIELLKCYVDSVRLFLALFSSLEKRRLCYRRVCPSVRPSVRL